MKNAGQQTLIPKSPESRGVSAFFPSINFVSRTNKPSRPDMRKIAGVGAGEGSRPVGSSLVAQKGGYLNKKGDLITFHLNFTSKRGRESPPPHLYDGIVVSHYFLTHFPQ
ncbi:MAG: hypothetical protein ABH852_04975, partial [Methanobacteriota archaeon]